MESMMSTAMSARFTSDATSDWNICSIANTKTSVLITGRTAVASPTAVIAATSSFANSERASSCGTPGVKSADMRVELDGRAVRRQDSAFAREQVRSGVQRRGGASPGDGVNALVAPSMTMRSASAAIAALRGVLF